MAGSPGRSTVPRHWWQRHPWAGLYCGWLVIAALTLGAARLWGWERV